MSRRADAAADTRVRDKPTVWSASWRYGLVGASGVLVNLAVFHLLHLEAGIAFPLASAVATETAIVWNYIGNERWTFHHRRFALRRLAKFNVSALAGLATTVAAATFVQTLAPPLLAQLVGIGAGAGLNFSLNFWWTWRR